MKRLNKRQKTKIIFLICISFFILLNVTVVTVQYGGFAFAAENYECRLLDIEIFGVRILNCYEAEEPPYWGCILCPWSS